MVCAHSSDDILVSKVIDVLGFCSILQKEDRACSSRDDDPYRWLVFAFANLFKLIGEDLEG